ncbi:hypothetical protein, partial [Caulobacter sp. B11]|uniref:hypothetical protein n=1 Tax=Caulobacter sp. B11 TaxID=2048899 RepID=UPI001F15F08B
PYTRNLHPLSPVEWRCVIRFPNEQPTFSNHFALPVKIIDDVPLQVVLGNAAWDLKGEFLNSARRLKRALSGKA